MWGLRILLFIAIGIFSKFKFPVLTTRISYPQIDDFEMECTLGEGNGTCINYKYCPSAQTSKEDPKTCYFEGFEHFVCCTDKLFEKFKNRTSAKACEVRDKLRHSIAGGIQTKPREFPFMIALGWESFVPNKYEYKCGGALIASRFVLTAAHCAYSKSAEPVVALPGGGNLNETSVPINRIKRVIVHPNYNPQENYHDIALVELEKPIENFKHTCIWGYYALEDDNVTAIGYGHTSFGGTSSNSLLKTYLTVTSNKKCEEYYKDNPMVPNGILSTQICAGDPQRVKDTCQGDSGGPILLPDVNEVHRPFIVGITSFGQGCATEVPGVYTRVSAYIDWIETNVWPN